MEMHTDPTHRTLPRLYSVEGLARHWSLKPGTVRAWARRGLLPGVKIGETWRFSEADLLKFLERSQRSSG